MAKPKPKVYLCRTCKRVVHFPQKVHAYPSCRACGYTLDEVTKKEAESMFERWLKDESP